MPGASTKNGNSKPKARKPRAYKLPKPLPMGEILTEHSKKRQWRIGQPIGQGGFGYIYLASDKVTEDVQQDASYVLKIEPKENGPLFSELHFYQRAAKGEKLEQFRKSHKLPYLGVPKFISTGLHETPKMKYRFMVMQRFGEDLYKKLQVSNQKFTPKITYMLAKRILHILEYIHEEGYIHADIKAANLMMGYGPTASNQVYLVDYGLAYRYLPDGKHKPYQEDPRKAHDGTLEYTSRDAHNGVAPSRRADVEILGYNVLHWLCGYLPWQGIADPDTVSAKKKKFMSSVGDLMKDCFKGRDIYGKAEVQKYLEYATQLKYDQKPDYKLLRALFDNALTKNGLKDDGKFNFSSDSTDASSNMKKNGPKAIPKQAETNASRGSPKRSARSARIQSMSPVRSSPRNNVVVTKRKSVKSSTEEGSPRKKVAVTKRKSVTSSTDEGPPRKKVVATKRKGVTSSTDEGSPRKKVVATKRKSVMSSSADDSIDESPNKIKRRGAVKRKPVCSLSSPDTSPEVKAKKSVSQKVKGKNAQSKVRCSTRKKVQMMDTEIQTSPGLLQRYIEQIMK